MFDEVLPMTQEENDDEELMVAIVLREDLLVWLRCG